MANPNFLILDEPTNDLDIYTLQILEQFLQTYKGCLIIVSHDRSFMDHIVDHLLVFEGDGKIKDYHSNYTQYRLERQQKERAAQLEQRDKKTNERACQTATKQALPNTKRKATYKEQKEYEALTQEIEALTEEKATLEKLLSEPSSSDDITQASTRIGEILALLDDKELRWLELDEIAGI